MMDMSYADLNDLTNWHGGFQKLLSSAMCYEPEAHELFQDTVRKMRLVHGLEQESCITGVSEEVKNFCRESSNHNVHSNSEDGVSDTTTHDEQNNAGAASMAASHSLEAMFAEGEAGKKRKRRRLKVLKNSEEVESQRMTIHIQVERNRRKQMNEYLSILRSLIPDSYIQRGDQASVIGGAIDLVKELETDVADTATAEDEEGQELRAENKSAVADIEVTLIESHASIKILSKKRPGQLLNIITALQSLNMTTLHLNITTIDQTIMFSFNIKIEEECRLNSANEIAAALQQILRMVHSDAIH